MTAIQMIADSAKDAGIRITLAYPDFNALVEERNTGKFELVINNEVQLSNSPYVYYDYLFRQPIAETQTTRNFQRYQNQRAWTLTTQLNKTQEHGHRGAAADQPSAAADPAHRPARDPALVQRHVGPVQHAVLDELRPLDRTQAPEHAVDMERLPEPDGHRRARAAEAALARPQRHRGLPGGAHRRPGSASRRRRNAP